MQTKKGFTLIELLVVVAIIGLLATLGVIAFRDAQRKARDSKRLADIRLVVSAFATANQEGKVLCASSCNAAVAAAPYINEVAICTPNPATGCVGATALTGSDMIVNLTNMKDPLFTGTKCTGANSACNYAFTGSPSIDNFVLNFATERTDVAGLAATLNHAANQNGVVQ